MTAYNPQQPALLQKHSHSHTPMWFQHRLFRTVATIVLAVFTTTSYGPAIAAIKNQPVTTTRASTYSADRQMVELIDQVRATLMSPADSVMRKTFDPEAVLTAFDALAHQIDTDIHNQQEQAKTAQGTTPKLLADLAAQQKAFQERSAAFRAKLAAIQPAALKKAAPQSFEPAVGNKTVLKTATKTGNPADGSALAEWLDEISPLKAPEDLTEMPFQLARPDPKNVPGDFTQEEATLKALEKNANLKHASFTDNQYKGSRAEAELTSDINAQARALNHNALNIYNWVRNNIEWQPTWGGQQTADMTLDVKRGNAMDIATLTIALFRAANIPARYVHGTVEIPVEKFKNMAGDFESLEAAMDFVSAGGIPVTSIRVNGVIKRVRIEHVWVEAALPYYPSQGTKPASANNPIDTWVPMDPSYKQYDYLNGLDTQTITDIDGEQLASDFTGSGTVNEEEGWVQGLNPTIIENAQTQAQQKLETHINGMQNPTVGDVIGGRTIKQETHTFFPSGLPYQKSVRAQAYNELPDSLRVRVTLGLGWDRIDQSYTQSKTWPLYQLNQRNITISFKPATTADENALKALIPENLTDPSQLPGFLPSSIKVIPEIKRDNEVLLTQSTALALGEEIDTGYHFITPTQSYLNKKDSVVAGSYLALGIVGSNMSAKTFIAIEKTLKETETIIENNNEADAKKLTREKTLGNMLVLGIQGYYSRYIWYSRKMAVEPRVNFHGIPMAGTFGIEPYQRKLLGINRGIEEHGAFMNVRTAQMVHSANGDLEKRKGFSLQIGTLSSFLENAVPETLFKRADGGSGRPEAFSAVKALKLASQAGQCIYRITAQNKTEALQKIKLDSLAMSEIRDALAIGKEVITHTDPLTVPGFKGAGYIIFDPETGDGAFKISGGKNGAFIVTLTLVILSLLMPIVLLSVSLWAAIIAGLFAVINAKNWIEGMKSADTDDQFMDANAMAAFSAFFTCIFGLFTGWTFTWASFELAALITACDLLMTGLTTIFGWM